MRIAVIGGGVNGIATAYFLARLSDAEVTVFERDTLASASTGYSAGIIRHHYATTRHIRLAHRGSQIIRNLPDLTGNDGGYRNNGYLRLAPPDTSEQFEAIVQKQQTVGVDVDLIDPASLPDHHPHINPAGVGAAAIDHDGGFADPYLVTTALAAAAAENGATIRTKTTVLGLDHDGQRVTGVETDEGTTPADAVVNAAGPWVADIAATLDLRLPLTWHESKIAVLAADTPYGPDLPSISDHTATPDMYTKPEPGGDFLVGGIDRPPIDNATGLTGVTDAFLTEASDRLTTRLPAYADADVVDTWSGIITMTPDAHQLAGPTPEYPNFYLLAGGSGHGFKEAPGFAESLAQTILDQEPRIDLTPYRPDRFADNELLHDVDYKTGT